MADGRFIVLEGPDGSGTTRHTHFLSERIQRETGREVLQTAEPTAGPIGKMIRELLHGERIPQPDAVQLLFCADRAEHVMREILPALESGKIVICDRYALSTIVYGSAQGLSIDWLTAVNAHFPQPDLTILTLPPFDVCMERTGRRDRRDQYEQEDFQRSIYQGYSSLAEDLSLPIVDTSGEKEDVAEEIWNIAKTLFA